MQQKHVKNTRTSLQPLLFLPPLSSHPSVSHRFFAVSSALCVFMIWGVYMLYRIWHLADLWLPYIHSRARPFTGCIYEPRVQLGVRRRGWVRWRGGHLSSHTDCNQPGRLMRLDRISGESLRCAHPARLFPESSSFRGQQRTGSLEKMPNIWNTGLARINNKSEEDIFEEPLMLDDRGFSQTRPKA